MTDDAQHAWDRRITETARAHHAFRVFRDLGALRRLDALPDVFNANSVRHWSKQHDWADRAAAWDDALHRAYDASRLDAIRTMHDTHARTGRMVMAKALAALANVKPDDIPPYVAGRLLELGARLERDTLTVSVEQLQGIDAPPDDDPWEIVARELEGVPET